MNSARGKVRTRVSPDSSPDAATRNAAVHEAMVRRDIERGIERGTVAGEARRATLVDDVPWRRTIAGTAPGRARGDAAWRTC